MLGVSAMSFSTFSKEFTANMFTSVENQFITKYLPQAEGDAVRVYLYGLYLCQCADDFDAQALSRLLKIPEEKIAEIYGFWEECDLVHILSRSPLFVEYLPVNSAIGKPKPVRAEKYTEFNRELYKQLQKAGKMFKPYEMQKILEFLETYPMEQQAFLLVSEYCAKKDGDRLSSSHILNKAKKLCAEHKYTYEQVERDLADFNEHERELSKIFTLLGINRKPTENDYDYLDKWLNGGIDVKTVYECAGALKKGTLSTLDSLVTEILEKDIHTATEAKNYLVRREELTNSVYKIAKKLAVKIQNPRAFSEEYVEKWAERGYDEQSLISIAALCFKLRYGFAEMDTLLDELYAAGVVDGEGVNDYCAARDKQFKLLQNIQSVCGVIRNTQGALDMIATWRSWNFSDGMILEAAKRSAGAAAPLPYMNKLLSEWKRTGVFSAASIPEKPAVNVKNEYKNEAAIAADKRSEREHAYAVRRQSANERADKARLSAERDEAFRVAEAAIRKGEIELARAEVFSPETLPAIIAELETNRQKRNAALLRLGLSEQDFIPNYVCKKCSDTGFLPDGRMCNCM